MKKKIKLNELTVQSFVTSLNKNQEANVRGGATGNGSICDLKNTILDSSPNVCHTNTLCPTTP